MKMTPELKQAQSNMAPGIITAEGFLGKDKRSLSTIIDEDEQILRYLQLDVDKLAERMEYFLDAGREGLGTSVTVDEDWVVRTDEARGRMACPWEDGVFRKINVTVERKDTGETIFYTALSIHLLKAHHFLEGRGSAFRLNLEALKHIFKMD